MHSSRPIDLVFNSPISGGLTPIQTPLPESEKGALEDKKCNWVKKNARVHVEDVLPCQCSVCQFKVPRTIKTPSDQEDLDNAKNFASSGSKLEQKDFVWLLDKLMGGIPKSRGCHVCLPETVCFRHGKPDFITKLDSHQCLTRTTNKTKLNLREIRKDFNKEAVNRTMNRPSTATGSREHLYNKELYSELVSVNPALQRGRGLGNLKADIYRGKERAIVRYNDESKIQIWSNNEFVKNMLRRASSPIWKSISCIQSFLNPKIGKGNVISIHFHAPFKDVDENGFVNYKYNEMGEDIKLIEDDPKKYCLKQCFRMAYFVAKHHHYEILAMKVEFLRDINGQIWMSYANNIITRFIQTKNKKKYALERIDLLGKDARSRLIAELEFHEEMAKKRKEKKIEKILELMSDYYDGIKNKVGMEYEIELTPENHDTDNAFEQLRPSSPYKYTHLMSTQFNPKIRTKITNMPNFNSGSVSKKMIKRGILYDEPIYERPKRPFSRDKLSQVAEGVRTIHNIIPTTNAKEIDPNHYVSFSKKPGKKKEILSIMRKNLTEDRLRKHAEQRYLKRLEIGTRNYQKNITPELSDIKYNNTIVRVRSQRLPQSEKVKRERTEKERKLDYLQLISRHKSLLLKDFTKYESERGYEVENSDEEPDPIYEQKYITCSTSNLATLKYTDPQILHQPELVADVVV